jgi:hypothetical protein
MLLGIRSPRLKVLISIVAITFLGFTTKFYSGPAAGWVNNSLGGVFYEIFWCLMVFFILPRLESWKIACIVFIITCLLEFLQLWHPPFLQTIRDTFIGATILGTTFVWSDFFYYVIGSLLGWDCIVVLHKD